MISSSTGPVLQPKHMVIVVLYLMSGVCMVYIHTTGVKYFEWVNDKLENTVLHWHFLGTDMQHRREEILMLGSECCGQGVYFSFWYESQLSKQPFVMRYLAVVPATQIGS